MLHKIAPLDEEVTLNLPGKSSHQVAPLDEEVTLNLPGKSSHQVAPLDEEVTLNLPGKSSHQVAPLDEEVTLNLPGKSSQASSAETKIMMPGNSSHASSTALVAKAKERLLREKEREDRERREKEREDRERREKRENARKDKEREDRERREKREKARKDKEREDRERNEEKERASREQEREKRKRREKEERESRPEPSSRALGAASVIRHGSLNCPENVSTANIVVQTYISASLVVLEKILEDAGGDFHGLFTIDLASQSAHILKLQYENANEISGPSGVERLLEGIRGGLQVARKVPLWFKAMREAKHELQSYALNIKEFYTDEGGRSSHPTEEEKRISCDAKMVVVGIRGTLAKRRREEAELFAIVLASPNGILIIDYSIKGIMVKVEEGSWLSNRPGKTQHIFAIQGEAAKKQVTILINDTKEHNIALRQWTLTPSSMPRAGLTRGEEVRVVPYLMSTPYWGTVMEAPNSKGTIKVQFLEEFVRPKEQNIEKVKWEDAKKRPGAPLEGEEVRVVPFSMSTPYWGRVTEAPK